MDTSIGPACLVIDIALRQTARHGSFPLGRAQHLDGSGRGFVAASGRHAMARPVREAAPLRLGSRSGWTWWIGRLWGTGPDALRRRIDESYHQVSRAGARA